MSNTAMPCHAMPTQPHATIMRHLPVGGLCHATPSHWSIPHAAQARGLTSSICTPISSMPAIEHGKGQHASVSPKVMDSRVRTEIHYTCRGSCQDVAAAAPTVPTWHRRQQVAAVVMSQRHTQEKKGDHECNGKHGPAAAVPQCEGQQGEPAGHKGNGC